MTGIEPNTYYEIHSKERPDLVIDVNDGSVHDSAAIILYEPNGGYNQQWSFEQVDGSTDRYVIVARHSGKCLDVSGSSPDDNVPVIQYAKNGGLNQQWSVEEDSSGTLRITAVHSRKMLDASMGARPNTRLIQYRPNGNPNQAWTLKER